MPFEKNQQDVLRNILENALKSRLLDEHPWTRSLLVRQEGADHLDLLDKSPGQWLIYAIARLFTQMMPATAPRRGKRLDTHWGEFGMLAAEYFSPLLFGEPAPASLGEAWGHIDQSILHFIFGKSGQNLSDTEKEPCKLVGYGDARVALLIMSNPTQLPGDDKPCTSSSEWEILSVVI